MMFAVEEGYQHNVYHVLTQYIQLYVLIKDVYCIKTTLKV